MEELYWPAQSPDYNLGLRDGVERLLRARPSQPTSVTSLMLSCLSELTVPQTHSKILQPTQMMSSYIGGGAPCYIYGIWRVPLSRATYVHAIYRFDQFGVKGPAVAAWRCWDLNSSVLTAELPLPVVMHQVVESDVQHAHRRDG